MVDGYISYGKSDVSIAVINSVVSKTIQEAITSGSYEAKEARVIPKLLRDGDVVAEFGSGVGLLSSIAALTHKASAIHCYEADPRLVDVIRATHDKNGVASPSLTVTHAAISADPEASRNGFIDFHLRDNFWAQSVMAAATGDKHVIRAPVMDLASVLRANAPTVLIIDIEGAELGLFDGVDLSSIRAIMVELHPDRIGSAGIKHLFDTLHSAGLVYDAGMSLGPVPVFVRGVERPGR